MTIPRISYYSALLIISEIEEIERFPTARKLCSYAGVVPLVHASGGKIRSDAITEQGSTWLRWILVELLVMGSARLKNLYKRVAKSLVKLLLG